MTKTDLQKELLEKVKGGIKPSDLKKPSKLPKSPSPISINEERSLSDFSKSDDEGYFSEEEQKIPTPPILPTKQIKELQNQVNFWSTTAQNHLKSLQLAQAKVSNLEEEVKELKNLKTPKSESELLIEKNKQIEIIALENEKNKKKVKELEISLKSLKNKIELDKETISKLQEKVKEQHKTMEDLQKQSKSKENDKQEPIKTFFCDSCQLTKTGTYIKRKVDAPFESRLHGRVCYLCSSCSPYVKELSEPNFDKDNNPYRIN